MGDVYRAEDTSTGELVALKRLHAEREERKRARLRFRREYHSLARMRHPRVVEVFDYGVSDDGAFYTMELLDGDDLKSLAPLGAPQACQMLRDIASALAFLHARGLVHRDLTPRNVRCTRSGEVKLIDFGVLATVGSQADLAGTPTFTAPETLEGREVDGRTDLFALGALGYALLTARVPFRARSFDELQAAWRQDLAPPSRYAESVSTALDELILELLCLDPLGRPASAAVVIDRLTAAGGLPRAPDLEVKQGYLASAAMVGRRREMSVLRGGLKDISKERITTAFVEAPSGTGKTRLLREFGLEAQTVGALVASVSCEEVSRGPYGVIAELLHRLVTTWPGAAEVVPGPDTGTIARVLKRLAPLLPRHSTTFPMADPGEERMRVQRAICNWLLAIAAERPVVLLVDDIQRADEASAAVLAALAREQEKVALYLAVALRTGEPIQALTAVSSLRNSVRHVSLTGLNDAEIEQLVRAYFGEVPYAKRLAHWLHETTNGSPLWCSELARHFVDTGVVRYADGLWVLPKEIGSLELPTGLNQAMEGRIGHLSAATRRFAEALAVHGGDLPLPVCVLLAEEMAEEQVFDALGELVAQAVLLQSGDSYHFRHDGLREALLRGLDDDRLCELHLHVGNKLSELGVTEDREAEIGWHLLRGGERQRGAELLELAGNRLYEAQALRDCLEPIEAALEALREAGAPETRTMDLELKLLAAGWVADRAVGARYAEAAVRAYWKHAGIALAARLGPWLGRHLGLIAGILLATIAWLFTLRRPRGPSPANAIVSFSVALGYACGLTYAAARREDLQRFVDLSEPLAVFRNRVPYAAYLGIQTFPDIINGHLGAGADKLSRAIEIVTTDRLTPATETERRFAEAGLRGLRVIIDNNQFHPRLHEDLRTIDELGFRYYQLVVDTARVVRHRYRGEEAKARHVEAAMETASLQLGSWSTDLQILLFAHPAYALCHDVMGLKQCADEIAHFIDDGFRFEARLAVTLGEYHREQGEYVAAERLLREALDELPEVDLLMRQWLGCALAEALLEAGQHEQALREADTVLELGLSPEHGILLPRLRCERIRAMADDALGRRDEAIERLERAIVLAEELDCPVIAGSLHDARARIALDAGDRLSYEVHCARASEWLRPTRNPPLIAALERLTRLGRGDGPSDPGKAEPEPGISDAETYELPSATRRRLLSATTKTTTSAD